MTMGVIGREVAITPSIAAEEDHLTLPGASVPST